jgi:hypothetical protein
MHPSSCCGAANSANKLLPLPLLLLLQGRMISGLFDSDWFQASA